MAPALCQCYQSNFYITKKMESSININICRICAEFNRNFHSINDDKIELKINKCFSTKVNKDDFNPKQICFSCYEKLNDFYKFIELFYESEEKFKVKFSTPACNDEKPKDTLKKSQNQTVLRHSRDFYKKIKSNNNEINKINQIKNLFSCQHCKKSFTRRNNLTIHLTLHTKTKPFGCEVCSKTFSNERHLKTHKITHTDKYKCETCQKSFNSSYKHQRHLRIHLEDKLFTCKTCGKSFTDKSNLKGHEMTHLNVKLFNCNVCNKSYRTGSHLRDHMKCHDEFLGYFCSDCGKRYKWKSNLIVHVKKKLENGCCDKNK